MDNSAAYRVNWKGEFYRPSGIKIRIPKCRIIKFIKTRYLRIFKPYYWRTKENQNVHLVKQNEDSQTKRAKLLILQKCDGLSPRFYASQTE